MLQEIRNATLLLGAAGISKYEEHMLLLLQVPDVPGKEIPLILSSIIYVKLILRLFLFSGRL